MMHNTGIKSGSSEASTAALSVSGSQPGWMTLDEARERAFTGEIVFEVDPEVLAYLDNGVVYYAERASMPPSVGGSSMPASSTGASSNEARYASATSSIPVACSNVRRRSIVMPCSS